MKARFYVTVELPTPNTSLGKLSKAETKQWAIDSINERIADSMQDLNPTNAVVRFPRATK
jgi:hypothetical protein